MIKWVYGNTLPLVVRLQEIIKTEVGETREDYIPPVGSEIEVWAVGQYKKKQFDYTIDGNTLFFCDDGTLSIGTYGIRVTVREPESRNLRSFKCEELEIVKCTDELELGEFVATDAVVLDTANFFWAKGDKGDTGNGIASTVLNADYTLTITFTDGTSYTTPIIRGEKGDKGEKGDAGTTDYNNLENKPDLSIYMQEITQEEYNEIFN